MRLMDDYLEDMNGALAIANWEVSLAKRDKLVERKRQEEISKEGIVLMNKIAKEYRSQKLKELYSDDELMYEQELFSMGLTFKRERI
jgi:hypothetical protein